MSSLWNLLFRKNTKCQPKDIQNVEYRLEPKHKLILTGNNRVGKTNILHIMVCKMFIPGLKTSTLTDFLNIEIPVKQEYMQTYKLNVKAVAQVWDVAGSKKFTTGADAGIIVYNISNLQSFEDVPFFVKDFKRTANCELIMIVGNKSDGIRAVPRSHGLALARQHNALFCECSAMDYMSVLEMFTDVMTAVKITMETSSVHIEEGKTARKKTEFRHILLQERYCCVYSDILFTVR